MGESQGLWDPKGSTCWGRGEEAVVRRAPLGKRYLSQDMKVV